MTDRPRRQWPAADRAFAREPRVQPSKMTGFDLLQRRGAEAGRDLVGDQLRPSFSGFCRCITGGPIPTPPLQKFADRFSAEVDQTAAGGFALQLDELGFSLPLRAPEGAIDGLALACRGIGAGFEFDLPTTNAAPSDMAAATSA